MKVLLVVFHFRGGVTALPTVCLFTQMSPAAMVTHAFTYLLVSSSVLLKHAPFYDFSTLKLKQVLKRHTDFIDVLTSLLQPGLMSVYAFNF